MGKGDKRTKRGKIFNGSYGKTRPGKKKSAQARAAQSNNSSSSSQ